MVNFERNHMARRSDHTREELRKLALVASRKIVEKEGLRGLRARQIARDIGYTIGTLYNMFNDLDDLVIHMNAETLDKLYDVCSNVKQTSNPVPDLEKLAHCYLDFTHANPKLWNAIFEHKMPPGEEFPDWYSQKVSKLLSIIESALSPLFSKAQAHEMEQHASVLWMSLFGIAAVQNADRLNEDETSFALVQTLINTYVSGLKLDVSGRKHL